jgi:hypothetical protein
VENHVVSRTQLFSGDADGLGSAVGRGRVRASWPLHLAVQVALLGLLCFVPAAGAGDLPTIDRVEEDWLIQIGVPSFDETAPQISIVNSPSGELSGKYAVFEINNLTLPDFFGGGLQLQTWSGDWNLAACHHPNVNTLALTGEQITFTTAMAVADGNLQFEVLNGQSQTWGPFGASGALKLSVTSPVSNLSGYSPNISTKYSRVSFASNRVQKLVLKQVRYFSNGNLVTTDTNSRVIQ